MIDYFKKTTLLAVISAGCVLATPASAVTELCLALDGSASIRAADFALQLQGYANNIADPDVIPQNSTVVVSVVQFSNVADLEIPPTLIDSQATADLLATEINMFSQQAAQTAIGDAINLCTTNFAFADPADRQIIDISTDGVSNTGAPTGPSADAAIMMGVDAINAIAIGNFDTAQISETVRPQPVTVLPEPGFLIEINDFTEFEPTLRAKIDAEVAPEPEPEPEPDPDPIGPDPDPDAVAVPALNAFGMILMALIVAVGGLFMVARLRRTS